PASNDVKASVAGTNNVVSLSSSTHNMWMNAEDGGSLVPSPSSPITDAINSLIHASDAIKPTLILQQQQSQRRQENMMAPGNVVGMGKNIDETNSDSTVTTISKATRKYDGAWKCSWNGEEH
nr:hypothetical protein [Tanacetum cinerariifolium]